MFFFGSGSNADVKLFIKLHMKKMGIQRPQQFGISIKNSKRVEGMNYPNHSCGIACG
jgi:hypothetical protein